MKRFKAISNSKRFKILELLSKKSMCCCELLSHFNVSQPTLSHDLKILTDSKIIESQKNEKCSIYTIKIDTIKRIIDDLSLLIK